MTTSNLTQRQLKWAEKLAEYDFKLTYQEGKKNPADDLLRQLNYELSKTVSTSTAAEIVWQFFCMRSKNYKSVQEKLYTLAAMTLQLKHSVQQIQQDDVVLNTTNTEDSSTTETSAVHDLSAQQASCNENDESVMSEDSSATETSAVHNHYAQEASCDKYDADTINTEDSSTTETSAVYDLSAQEASCNDKSVMFKTDNMTETSAVHHQYAQRVSCVMSEEISDVTEAHTVQCLSA